MPGSEPGGVKDDEVILLSPQAPKHTQKRAGPEWRPGSFGAGAGEKKVGLLRRGPREKRMVADFENTKRLHCCLRLWRLLHAGLYPIFPVKVISQRVRPRQAAAG